MNVLHIATKDTGGAGIAAIRIHNALNKYLPNSKLKSRLLLLWCNNEQNLKPGNGIVTYQSFYPVRKKLGDYQSFIHKRFFSTNNISTKFIKGNYYQSFYKPEIIPLLDWVDIIHLHWVNGFVNPFHFLKKINKPIVWTFHDMTPFSGGNPYESGIFKDKLELFRPFLNKKIKLFQQHGRIYGHATSDTFKLKAVNQYQTFKDSKTEVIPYPLDPNHYEIIQQNIARTKLNLKSNKPVLLFVAADTNNKRKGIQYLINSPQIKDFTLLMVGKKSNNLEKLPNIIQLGTLDIPKLNLAYSAADLFITPAIEEAFGQTTIESFYCGTPVVAFPTAGAKQIIQPYKNGIIADTIDNKALYKAINKALSTSFNRKEISIKAKETFNPQKISQQFLSFYNKILQNEK